jgi:hypothetical protein
MIYAGQPQKEKGSERRRTEQNSQNEKLLHTPARAELLLSSSAQANLRKFFDLPTPKPAVFG